jgi:DNA-binding GntR family transcriptional regulator
VLEERFGVRPARARFGEATPADPRRAHLLGLETGQPLLPGASSSRRTTPGGAIELCEMVYRLRRYRFRATLVRGG